jgi:hypothetical protein
MALTDYADRRHEHGSACKARRRPALAVFDEHLDRSAPRRTNACPRNVIWRDDIWRSQTRDCRSGITRECVTGDAGTSSYSKDSSDCPVAKMRSGVVFSFGEVSCRIHYIERNVVVIWQRNAAPSLHYLRMSQHCRSLAEAEKLGMLAYGR